MTPIASLTHIICFAHLCLCANITSMRTTIDVPDELLHRAKIIAAQRKTTIKELVIWGLDYATRHSLPDAETERKATVSRLLLGMQAANDSPMVPLAREEIYER